MQLDARKKKYAVEFPLHKAANDGDLATLKSLVLSRECECINSVDAHLNTPLHLAAHGGHILVVRWLLDFEEAGKRICNPNATDLYRRTPLHLACSSACYEVVKFLLSLNTRALSNSRRVLVVSVDCQDANGRTPLLNSLRKGYADLVKLLLEHGADPNIQDDYLQSCLHHACLRTKQIPAPQALECIRLLVHHGADVNLRDVHGFTPVHICALNNSPDRAQALLEKNQWNPRITSSHGLTALELAKKEGNTEIAMYLQHMTDEIILSTLRQRPMATWVQLDVADWVEAIGFPQYRDLFLQHNINGSALQRLDAERLKHDIGIGSFGHRDQVASRIVEFSCSPAQAGAEGSTTIDDSDVDSVDSLLLQAKQWEINPSDLTIGDVIGKGFFGEVRRGVWKGIEVAVKSIHRNLGTDTEQKRFYKEIAILSQLRHPNIIALLGFVRTTKNGIMMVTELMSGGTLYLLRCNNFATLDRLRGRIIVDIVRGMLYLHSRTPPVLHRDLNTKNLLLDDHWMTKLSDFGLSRVKDELHSMTSNVGFLANIAPEVFRGEKYSEKADVFSFAMVLYELFTGREPHEGMDILKYANKVAHEGFRPAFPDPTAVTDSLASENPGHPTFNTLIIHPEWKLLIEDCWNSNPDIRPSFSNIMERVNSLLQLKVPTTTSGSKPRLSSPVFLTQSTAKADKAAQPNLNVSGYIT